MVGARGTSVLLLVLSVAVTACADRTSPAGPSAAPAATSGPAPSAAAPAAPPAGTAPAEPAGTAPAEPEEQRCDHPTEGYSIALPPDWHVAADEGIEPCTFFHPEPLALPQDGEATGVAIRAEVREAPFEQARQDVLDEGGQVLEEREVTERAAVRIEGTLTEEGLLPAGTRFTTWLVELDAGTLVLTTDDAGRDDYGVAVEVLDAMAESLEIP